MLSAPCLGLLTYGLRTDQRGWKRLWLALSASAKASAGDDWQTWPLSQGWVSRGGGQHGTMGNIWHFTRSQAFWILTPHFWRLNVWFHMPLWISVLKRGKCILRTWDWFQWFSYFTLPRVYLWSCSPLLCFENVWFNYEKKHHLYLESAIKSWQAISQRNASMVGDH